MMHSAALLNLTFIPMVLYGQQSPQSPTAPTVSTTQPAPPLPARAPPPTDTQLEEIVVRSTRIAQPPPSLDRIEVYGSDDIERADAFTTDEVLRTLPPSLPGAGQTVLIDGRKSTLDPAILPVGMIERIEVNLDGTLPEGGHVAGTVVNIILKKNYSGANLNLRADNSFAGGGDRQQATFDGGSKKDGVGTTVMVTHKVTDALTANHRDFSDDQGHTAWGGRDFRLPWGYPAAVQALSGNLNGVVNAKGQPVATALLPQILPAVPLTPEIFIPGPLGVTDATGLRQFNTAADLYLVAPSTSDSINVLFAHPLTETIRVDASYGLTHSESQTLSPPPVTAASSASVVPAAYNPFGQDVSVGLVNVGFGGIRQVSTTTMHNAEFGLNGRAGSKWEWNAHIMLSHTASEQSSPELDPTLLSESLAATDASQRFDPFAPDRPGSANAGLYPALTRINVSDTISQQGSLVLDAHGKLGDNWAGPVKLAVATDYGINESRQGTEGLVDSPSGTTDLRTNTLHASTNLDIPVFNFHESGSPTTLTLHANGTKDLQHSISSLSDEPPSTNIDALAFDGTLRIPWTAPNDLRPGLYRLETALGAGKALSTGSQAAGTQNMVLLWMPIQSLTLRVGDTKQQVAPPTAIYPLTASYEQTLMDPLRNVPTATGVQVTSGVPAGLLASFNHLRTVAIDFAPLALKGFKLTVNYTVQDLEDPIRSLSAQDIIDNEAALPGRVTRLPPSAEDVALGQPGQLVAVNITPLNAGSARTRALDYAVNFRSSDLSIGNLSLNARIRHLLESNNDLLPRVPVISTSDSEDPPDWTYFGQADWKLGAWSVDAQYNRTGGGHYGDLPYSAYTDIDLRVSYRFKTPLIGKSGDGPQLGLGIGNLLDADPPRVDTLTGYRGGSPLGRTYRLTLRLPL